MKVLTLQQRLRIIIGLFCLILVAIICVVIYPTARTILTLQEEIDTTEAFLESQYQKTKRMQRSITNLDAVVSTTATFIDLTVPTNQELFLIETFESLARTYNIEQTLGVDYTSTPDPDVRQPYYTFSFLHHGQLEKQLALLDAIQSLPYIVAIDSMDMQRRNNTTAQRAADTPVRNDVTLRFSARIYAR